MIYPVYSVIHLLNNRGQVYNLHLKCVMVTQSSQAATARKNRDIYIYLLQFIAVVSGGYKIDFNFNNILATLCLQFLR